MASFDLKNFKLNHFYVKLFLVLAFLAVAVYLFYYFSSVSIVNLNANSGSLVSVNNSGHNSSAGNSVATECSVNSDCNDGNQCTVDSCIGGKCVFTTIKDCIPKQGNSLNGNLGANSSNSTETNCYDLIDNDGDGLIDCQDPDCEGLPCMPDGLSICHYGDCMQV